MPKFESHGVRGGVWSGHLTAPERPGRVCLVAMGEPVAEARLTDRDGGGWDLRVDLPGSLLSDGTICLILVADEDSTADTPIGPQSRHLARLILSAGKALDDDVTSEIAQLRAELDLLKREFRRLAMDRKG